MIDYEKIFLEVCEGISPTSERGVFVKHLTLKEKIKVNAFKKKNTDLLISQGHKTEKEVLEILRSNNLWTEENQKKLEQKEREYKGISSALPKILKDSEKKRTKEYLDTISAELNELLKHKNYLLGVTVENSVDVLAREYEISLSFCNEKFEDLFCWEEWDYLDDQDSEKYKKLFYAHITEFTDYNVGNICVQEFFKDIYYLYPQENIYMIWNRKAHEHTFYQLSLSEKAKFARGFIQNNPKVSDDVKNDIYKMIKYNNDGESKKPQLSGVSAADEAKRLNKLSGGGAFNLIKDVNKVK